jgi:hypothetical protein
MRKVTIYLGSAEIMYHVNSRKNHGDILDERNIQSNIFTAIELAKYVLMRLVDIQSIEKLAEEFDGDVRFINGVIEFLKDIKWVEQDHHSGLYQLTDIGQTKVNVSKLIVWI